jgi:hypothetical protein
MGPKKEKCKFNELHTSWFLCLLAASGEIMMAIGLIGGYSSALGDILIDYI